MTTNRSGSKDDFIVENFKNTNEPSIKTTLNEVGIQLNQNKYTLNGSLVEFIPDFINEITN